MSSYSLSWQSWNQFGWRESRSQSPFFCGGGGQCFTRLTRGSGRLKVCGSVKERRILWSACWFVGPSLRGRPKPNSPQLFRIASAHTFFRWQTSTKAVLIAGNNPEPPDRPLFRLTCCQWWWRTWGNPHAWEHSESRPSAGTMLLDSCIVFFFWVWKFPHTGKTKNNLKISSI